MKNNDPKFGLSIKKNFQEGDNDDSSDFFPLMTPEEEEQMFETAGLPSDLPILPLKNTVLFPGVIIPITVTREKSVKLVKKAYKSDKMIGVIAQKNNSEEPTSDDLFSIGTLAHIIKMLVLPDGNTTIIIQGKSKFSIVEYISSTPYLRAKVNYISDKPINLRKRESKALTESLRDLAVKMIKLNPDVPQEARIAIDNIESPNFLNYFLASNLNADRNEKQRLLEINDSNQRSLELIELMMKEVQILELKSEIQNKAQFDIEQQQRDYFLRAQLKVLQNELGNEGPEQEVNEFTERAEKKKWTAEVKAYFDKELSKLSRINPMSPEYGVSLNYIEWLLDLPWGEYTKDVFNLEKAQKVLEREHFGLEKPKERILEYLAVLQLKKDLKAPILCFYGPPGVGKTSLARSIAHALGRKEVRVSLGGVKDEAEIRGHRRTYIGAMPGKIVQNLKKAGTANPVFILDEIDKVGNDFRGDPSSALLEALDPELNNKFIDHYLEVEFDLSRVLFVATANSLETIHPALLDRMEVIEINSYTLEEKVQIAKRHLIPKILSDHGLDKRQYQFSDLAIQRIIEGYTKEAGVRNLNREIGSIVRKSARKMLTKVEHPNKISPQVVEDLLGIERFSNEKYQDIGMAGVSIGLAWTPVGGEILFIEANLSRGKGQLTISGHLGDVMKESAVAALSFLKSNADKYNIDHRLFQSYDLHIHIPQGAVPKDGPSAGVAILTALVSAFTQKKVTPKLAMTGEITLRGRVLPVGGIKEKILAAVRAGITTVLLPAENRKDISEINPLYIEGLNVIYIDTAFQALKEAISDVKADNPLQLELF